MWLREKDNRAPLKTRLDLLRILRNRGARRVFNKSININDLLKTSQIKIKETSKKLKFLEVSNTILEEVFNDWKGTAFHNQHTYHFFMQIKELCPQTVFHGTDVGHQYGTTGERFLRYLESKQ